MAPIHCDAAETLEAVAHRLRAASAAFAVVHKNGRVAGIVTARQLAVRLHDPRGRLLRAGNVMTFRTRAARARGLAA